MSIVSAAIEASLAASAVLHGESVTFARGQNISVEISGIIMGRTEWKGLGKGGMVVLSESVDFLVPVAQLVDSSGNLLEPERYDQFAIELNDVAYVYDVQYFGPDELLWRWHDRGGRTVRRVFTKLFSEEAA